MYRVLLFSVLVMFIQCQQADEPVPSFRSDLSFLEKHTDVVVLKDAREKAMIAVVPAWQGRVMTSTGNGPKGNSYGWINRELISSHEVQRHINAFGGEDRFWLGPEGGQYALYFVPGVPFDLEHWQVPPSLDTEPFRVISKTVREITLQQDMRLTNYSATEFDLRADRTVRLIDAGLYLKDKGIELSEDISAVGYTSVNRVTNTGKNPWNKDRGTVSIWILGMFNATNQSTVIIPFNEGPVEELGPVVNDRYFGEVGPDRLAIRDGIIYFKADARQRSKIGLSPLRGKPVLGSYDAGKGILNAIYYTKPDAVSDYVNSMWEVQDKPYSGDVVNSYNDGPSQPGGTQLGTFYELESSSPALALESGESYTHEHTTIHMEGPIEDLNQIASMLFGVNVSEIETVFVK